MKLSVVKNRISLVMMTVLGGLTLILAIFVLLTGLHTSAKADPGILYVAPDGLCGGATPCYDNVQAAINAAVVNDEIRVATGTYTEINNLNGLAQIVYIDKTINICGGYSTTNWNNSDPETNPTTLDAQGLGRVIYITGDVSPVIEGFHITNGRASGLGGDPWFGYDAGSGIYVISATATIKNNQIHYNTYASFGGGIYINRSGSIISHNIINNNSASDGGGIGIWYSNATLDSNVITNNSFNGVWVYGSGYTFQNNTVMNNSGRGFYLYYGSAVFNGNTIKNNDRGGVSLLTYSSASFNGDKIINNSALSNGGGLYMSWHSQAIMRNTVIADNQANGLGSGIYVDSAVLDSLHTTLARNSGGDGRGVYVTDKNGLHSTAILSNTILVDHNVGIEVTGGNTVTVNAVLWHNTPVTMTRAVTAVVAIQNQHTGDPTFAPDGYHLLAGSAAVDAGLNFGLSQDIDGGVRPIGDAPDIGADELATNLDVNYMSGSPGSFFTLIGTNFPPSNVATVSVNGVTLGTVAVDTSGSFTLTLDTTNADEGAYFATASVNPSATARFVLDSSEPTRPKENNGILFDIPSGIAFTEVIYLPSVLR